MLKLFHQKHILLCRFPDTRRSGKWLAEKLLEKGIKIKHFVPVQDENFDEYLTLGVGIENDFSVKNWKKYYDPICIING